MFVYNYLFFQVFRLLNTSCVIRVPRLYGLPPYTPLVWIAMLQVPQLLEL